jgi:zinc transport system substrate-binding protein
MNKLLIGIVVVLVLAGCAPKVEPAEKPSIVVSFYILEDFTRRIAQDKLEIINIMGNALDAHDFEPTTQDMVTLMEADYVVVLGNDYEHWAESVFPELISDEPKLLVVGEGFELISHPISNQLDPHIWLSLSNAVTMLERIATFLSEEDPTNAAFYAANLETEKAAFLALDQRYRSELATRVRDEFIPNHAAFGYLAKDYGLTMIPIMGLEPDAEPDAATMATIIETVKAYGIPYILYEDEADTAVAETIASETGAQTGLLTPIENLTSAQLAAGDDYLSLMESNLEWLKKALGE